MQAEKKNIVVSSILLGTCVLFLLLLLMSQWEYMIILNDTLYRFCSAIINIGIFFFVFFVEMILWLTNWRKYRRNRKETRRLNTILNISSIGALLFCLLFFVFFIFGAGRPANATNNLKITKEDEQTILNYLNSSKIDHDALREGEKTASAFDILGTDRYKIYLLFVTRHYLTQDNQNKLTSGTAGPAVLYVSDKKGRLQIIDYRLPNDETVFERYLNQLFPENILKDMDNYNERANKLESELESRIGGKIIK